jgi:hypothetical protein
VSFLVAKQLKKLLMSVLPPSQVSFFLSSTVLNMQTKLPDQTKPTKQKPTKQKPTKQKPTKQKGLSGVFKGFQGFQGFYDGFQVLYSHGFDGFFKVLNYFKVFKKF